MKKKLSVKYLLGIMILIFLVVNVIWIIIDIKGRPLDKQNAETKLINYLQTTYPGYESQFDVGEAVYSVKEKSYTMQCVYRNQPRLYFEVMQAYDGAIYDNYEEEFLKGTTAWKDFNFEQFLKIDKEHLETCKIEFDYCGDTMYLDDIDEKSKDDFYHNRNMDQIKTLSMDVTKVMDDPNIEEMVASFHTLDTIFYDDQTVIKSYSIMFVDEDGSLIYYVQNVDRELLERSDFPVLLSEALHQYDKYKECYGFFIT